MTVIAMANPRCLRTLLIVQAHFYDLQWLGYALGCSWRICGLPAIWGLDCHEVCRVPLIPGVRCNAIRVLEI
jgi:hypothetical protein